MIDTLILAADPRITQIERNDDVGINRLRIYFANGYAASIIEFALWQGRYEIAVLHDEHLVYDTGITGDVIGHLRADEVPDILNQIAALSPR